MKRLLLIPILILTISSLALSQTSGVNTNAKSNPFAGTWKANLSKSKQHPNHLFESATLRFEVSDEVVSLTFSGVNMAGEQESGTSRLNPDGKEHSAAEAPGVIVVTKWLGSHTLETVAKKDGKVVGQSAYEVSRDGKMLTAKVKGIDASGAAFEHIIVFDRQ